MIRRADCIPQNNIYPVHFYPKPKENSSVVNSNHSVGSNNVPPKNTQNSVPNTNAPKINQSIPSNITNNNKSTQVQNSLNSSQTAPRSAQTNPPANPFKSNTSSSQVVNIFAPPRIPSQSPTITSSSNNNSSITTSSQYTSTSVASSSGSSSLQPRSQAASRPRVAVEPGRRTSLIREF